MEAAPRWVLHVAPHGDAHILGTLASLTYVLEAAGMRQVLLLTDGETHGDPAPSLAPSVEVRTLRAAAPSALARYRALQSALGELACVRPLYAIHCHGVWACAMTARALRDVDPARGVPILHTPHLQHCARSAGWTGALMPRLLQVLLASPEHPPLVSSPTEAEALSKLLGRSADVLPYVVAQPFFDVPRDDDAPPCVVGAGVGTEAVQTYTRLAVLLGGGENAVPFHWLGAPDAALQAMLRAANVGLWQPASVAEWAQALAAASVFVYVSPSEEGSEVLVHAMAAGAPCLVNDVPAQRALVRHGETGYVCSSERDLLEMTARLLSDADERRRIGAAARAEAARRFTVSHFERAVRRAYGLPEPEPAAGRRAVGRRVRAVLESEPTDLVPECPSSN